MLDEAIVRILVNHELGFNRGYPYEIKGASGPIEMTGARVSYFDVDKDNREVKAAGIAYTTVYDASRWASRRCRIFISSQQKNGHSEVAAKTSC